MLVAHPANQGLGESGIPLASGATSGEQQESEYLEAKLVDMTVWLLTKSLLVQLQEYLVTMDALMEADDDTKSREDGEGKTEVGNANQGADDILYQQLFEANCLAGTKSLSMIAWRVSVETGALREWALRHDKVRIILRLPAPSDDQEIAEADAQPI